MKNSKWFNEYYFNIDKSDVYFSSVIMLMGLLQPSSRLPNTAIAGQVGGRDNNRSHKSDCNNILTYKSDE